MIAQTLVDSIQDELLETREQLEAAKQRELELLAYSEELFTALWTMPDGERVADAIMKLHNPSQALREHEAKLLDEVFKIAELFPDDGLETASRIRRMAEERRKK